MPICRSNWPSVTPRQLTRMVHLCLKAKRNLLVGGLHGIGKSSVLQEAADHAGFDTCVIDLSLLESSDLTGLPYRAGKQTKYAKPVILPTRTARGKKGGLLILEELNRCERLTRQPALQLLTSGTLNDYELPSGWSVAACINRNGENDEMVYDTDELDPALLSRFACVTLVPSIGDWLEWAQRNGIHEKVRRFVQSNEQVFIKTNPRSFAYLSDMLATADRDEDVLLAAQSVLQDKATALAFFHHFSTEADGDAGETVGATPPEKEHDAIKVLSTMNSAELYEYALSVLMELESRREPVGPLKAGDRVQALHCEDFEGIVTRIGKRSIYVKNEEDGEVYNLDPACVKPLSGSTP